MSSKAAISIQCLGNPYCCQKVSRGEEDNRQADQKQLTFSNISGIYDSNEIGR